MSFISVTPATINDLLEIKALAKSLDLDLEDMSYAQFVVAKHDNEIVGCGRLRPHDTCIELATVGIKPAFQNKGIGGMVIRKLIELGPESLYVTCVIPDFFKRFGFKETKTFPFTLRKKVDFCKSYNYTDDQVFVMKFEQQKHG